MKLDMLTALFVFMLATFLGLDIIRRVSRLLHTPLMSLTNAISAVTVVGVPLSRVPLTAVPERTGLSQAFGGLAAALVGVAKYYLWLGEGSLTHFKMGVIGGEVILGCLTCTGGLLAAGKLAEMIPTRPI